MTRHFKDNPELQALSEELTKEFEWVGAYWPKINWFAQLQKWINNQWKPEAILETLRDSKWHRKSIKHPVPYFASVISGKSQQIRKNEHLEKARLGDLEFDKLIDAIKKINQKGE